MGLSSGLYPDEEINTDRSYQLFWLSDGGPIVRLGPLDDCQTKDLGDLEDFVDLLHAELLMPLDSDPDYSGMGTGINVDMDNLSSASEGHAFKLNYISADLGLINLRIGGDMAYPTAYSTVVRTTTDGGVSPKVDTYNFSGGSVIVRARAYRKRGKTPILQCILPPTTHSTFTVTWPSGS